MIGLCLLMESFWQINIIQCIQKNIGELIHLICHQIGLKEDWQKKIFLKH